MAIYFFDHDWGEQDPRAVIGGKGASLAAMTAMGLPVPPGFTLPIGGHWSMDEVRDGLARLGTILDRTFGDGLRVSVRSGAATSMPGMMDTVLNVGGEANPFAEIERHIHAVYDSWDAPRACHYRDAEGLSHEGGTAVTVQAMVLGDLNPDSGTGVVFSRCPKTGERRPQGDYLPQAQGEAVVAGEAATLDLAALAARHPDIHSELMGYLDRLELHYRDMVDVEFTVEDARLFVLQARAGKRTPEAAARIAVEMADDPGFPLSRAEAVARVPDSYWAAHGVARASGSVLTTGLGASPGVASGAIVLDADSAVERMDEDLILVREATSPADIHGMSAARGILTTLGGQMSHAAVVARGWSLPAVVGAGDVRIGAGEIHIKGRRFGEGEIITIDGGSGAVFAGTVAATRDAPDPARDTLNQWREELS